MTEAFKNVNKIHDAREIPTKPGWLRGWLKGAPQLIQNQGGHLVCTAQYIFGDWPEKLYEKVKE